MPTKDPHIALIDAQEQLHHIRIGIKRKIAEVEAKAGAGGLTADDKQAIKEFIWQAVSATRKVQEKFFEELESHGRIS